MYAVSKTVSVIPIICALLFAQTSPTTEPFYTLTDLNSRLETGAAGTAVPFAQPTGAPGTVTVKSLAEIMAKMPAVNSSAALDNQVIAGRWFWGLDASGWGLKQGTLAVNPPLAIVPGTGAQTIPAGYYASAGSVAGDANLLAGNIKSGVTIFNVAGTAPVPSGTATAEKVLAGSTFSNDNGTAIPGTMANIGVQNITPSTSEQSISAGFHNGSGKVAGDVNLISDNILSGKTIFGVQGNTNVVNTSSGDALNTDILAGKTAWVDGAEVLGTRHSITYHTTGGYIHEDNPHTLQTGESFTLKGAVKSGFFFDGWYSEEALQTPITALQAGTTGNIHLYAKWRTAISNFVFTGSEQIWTAPISAKRIQIECWGAQGMGNGKHNGVNAPPYGGKGGYTKATFACSPGQKYYIFVGSSGGWNGGGGIKNFTGGGATDVRTGSTLDDRFIVAGGGGSAGGYEDMYGNPGYIFEGGAGGGMDGADGSDPQYGGKGGKSPYSYNRNGQIILVPGSGGLGGGTGTYSGSAGELGIGGTGRVDAGGKIYISGGGGGGYFGGGGGGVGYSANIPGSGGGGSGYIAGAESEGQVMESGVEGGNGKVVITILE